MTLTKYDAIVALGIGAVAVIAQTADAMPAPSSFWPTSVVAWINAFVGICTAFGLIYAFHRFTQKPALDAVNALRQSMVESKKDREHQSGMIERFGREFHEYRKEQQQREDRIMDAIAILRADR